MQRSRKEMYVRVKEAKKHSPMSAEATVVETPGLDDRYSLV